jgi:hypothetical protein
MTDALQSLLAPPALKTTLYPPSSRYHGLDLQTLVTDKGEVIYLKRRFVPAPETLAAFDYHSVVEGDRLDNLASTYLGDPELFWRICDGNGARRPDELIETIGRRLRITLPEGVPGATSG